MSIALILSTIAYISITVIPFCYSTISLFDSLFESTNVTTIATINDIAIPIK